MKLIIVVGARPNFMKVGSIMRAFQSARGASPGAEVLLLHTGQHYDAAMSGNFFRDLEMAPPDICLEAGSGSHAQQTARIMSLFEPVCLSQRPDWVVVVGDVNSTIACALTACKLGIRVAHVEAGLRSHDRTMPEEINRLCTDAIADLLFTTDREAGDNLRREAVAEEKIHFVGNTMIDTLLRFRDSAAALPLPEGLRAGEFAVVTLHRPSNVDGRETLSSLLHTLAELSRTLPLVFPVHPRTRSRMEEFGLLAGVQAEPGMRLLDPLSYLPFLGLVARSRMVLTDSGGIQEETSALGVPCITLRANTERAITCDLGGNTLVGSDPAAIRSAAMAALQRRAGEARLPELWDGHAGERIVQILLRTGSRKAPHSSPVAA